MTAENKQDRRDPQKVRPQDESHEIHEMIRRSKSLIERVDELLGRKKEQDPPPEIVR